MKIYTATGPPYTCRICDIEFNYEMAYFVGKTKRTMLYCIDCLPKMRPVAFIGSGRGYWNNQPYTLFDQKNAIAPIWYRRWWWHIQQMWKFSGSR